MTSISATEGPRQDEPAAGVARLRTRTQALLALTVVAVWPWLVDPGRIQPDTKLDLVVSPGRYLERALWAWNDHAGLGELQNQAYGYLWPMGPFFWLGQAAGMPEWAVQRAWWSLLLVVAAAGVIRLSRRLLGVPMGAAIVAGVAFALAPRVLTVLAEISVEVWPYALAPWLVLAAARLVAPESPGAVRRAVVATGLLTATLGGVNATVSLVALVPAAAWILTAPRGSRRGRALVAWLLGAVLGALWWLGPLLVLGRYSYPFLDYIELASTTTAVASIVNVLRGAEHWVAYILTAGDNPTWQSGWVLAQSFVGIVGTCAVAGLGLAGLLRIRAARSNSSSLAVSGARSHTASHVARWGIALVLLGVLVMAIGRSGAAQGPLAPQVQAFLDGPGAAFRNVHKADLLVRLPIALGLAATWGWATSHVAGLRGQVTVVAVVLGLLGATLPIWQGRVGDAWSYQALPPEWHQVAAAVDRDAAIAGGSTLVLPGARTADHTWGRTGDEPLTALASSPVIVRAAAPLGHPAATRVLDGIDALTGAGEGSSALAGQFHRLGAKRVVVRWSIDEHVGTVDPDAVARALDASPGLVRRGEVGEGAGRIVWWEVEKDSSPATDYPAAGAISVAGAPEAWTRLVESGLIDPTAAMLLDDDTARGDNRQGQGEAQQGLPTVSSDTLRWQEFNAGRPPLAANSPTLVADDLRPSTMGTRALPPGDSLTHATTREWRGIESVTTSSSAADPFGRGWRSAGDGPEAALDGDPATAWISGAGDPAPTLVIDAGGSPQPREVTVSLPDEDGLARVAQVRVDGSAANLEGTTARATRSADATGPIRIQVLPVQGVDPSTSQVGISEVTLDGRPVRASLRVPAGTATLLTRDPRALEIADGEDPASLFRSVELPEGEIDAHVAVRPPQGATWRQALESLPGDAATSAASDSLPCGHAGRLAIGGAEVPLSLDVPEAALDGRAVLPAGTCRTPTSAGGRLEVDVLASPAALPEWVALRPGGSGEADVAPSRRANAERLHPGGWTVDIAEPGESLLTLTQGANRGWRATTADGTRLAPVTVDGWRQAFVVPEGTAGPVRIEFAPNRAHRGALLAGAMAILALLGAAALDRRGVLAATRRPAPPLAAAPTRPPSTAGVAGTAATLAGSLKAPRPAAAMVLAAIVGLLVAGPVGVVAAAAGALVPARRWTLTVAVGMAATGAAVALLGVADRLSAGAWVGQGLGAFMVGVLVSALVWGPGGGPSAGSDARPMSRRDGR